MTYDELTVLRDSLLLLSEGKDTRTGVFVDDSILNSKYNKHVITSAANIIDTLLRYGFKTDRVDKRRKQRFHLTDDEKRNVPYSEEPIPVSKFTHIINENKNDQTMKRLKATEITNWLVNKDYLRENTDTDGRKFKTLTDSSMSIGLSSETRTSDSGRVYEVILYNKTCQQYIIEHLDEIVGLNSDII